MSDLDLTPEEWQYISMLIAADIRREAKPSELVEKHWRIWEKIQSACQWDRMF